jgi:hypothetical protein
MARTRHAKDASETYFHLSDADSQRLMKKVPFDQPDDAEEAS